MKNTRPNSILRSSLIACVLTIGSLASTQSASAQESTSLVRVDIPFAFQMANRTFPAGTYQIDREPHDLIRLLGPDKSSSFQVMFDAAKVQPADHAAVIFHHSGGKYFLRQIWTAGATYGLECPMSRTESNAEKAENKQAATSVEVAFNNAPVK
jgi:hypothetical protein